MNLLHTMVLVTIYTTTKYGRELFATKSGEQTWAGITCLKEYEGILHVELQNINLVCGCVLASVSSSQPSGLTCGRD